MDDPTASALSDRGRTALAIAWPAFLMAGVMEMIVFAFVDPGDLHWLDGAPLELSRQAVYTVAFFVFWAVIGAAGVATALLRRGAADINAA
jgi:hypothetical protein